MGSKTGMLKFFTATVAVLATVAICSIPAFAGTGTFGSYIGIDDNSGSGNVWYGGNQPGPNTLDAFNGKWLGAWNFQFECQSDSRELSSGAGGRHAADMQHFGVPSYFDFSYLL